MRPNEGFPQFPGDPPHHILPSMTQRLSSLDKLAETAAAALPRMSTGQDGARRTKRCTRWPLSTSVM